MTVTGPNTGFRIVNVGGGPLTQDLGQRYVSKDYLIDVYPELISGYKSPGLWAWGQNYNGQLGDNTSTSKSSPVQVGSLTNWKFVSLGQAHTAAIKTDGTLWAWGFNASGRLGLNDTTTRFSPVQVGTLTNWKMVSAGLYNSLAVKTDGTLWAWGQNTPQGSLGLNDIVDRSSPVQVGTLTNWKMVSAGQSRSGAITTNGGLWTWGNNSGGGLGLNDLTHRSSPVQVGSLTNWKFVSVNDQTLAIKTDGTLWAWGFNASGQLGLDDIANRSSPVQVGILTNWKQVSTGRNHSAAVKTDGTLWVWGQNSYGQLGLNSINPNRSSPIQVGTLTNWSQVTAGRFNTAAVKTDGTLWTWGRNSDGQLGLGFILHRSSPVQVGTLTNWKQVSTGASSFHLLAIVDGYY